MDSPTLPLISCLCITKNKIEKLDRSVQCFFNQRHQEKELLIVYEDNNRNMVDYLQQLNLVHNYDTSKIKVIEIPSIPKLTLGELRNIAIEDCSGEYFCQWDDDDWYHSDRLSVQLNSLLDGKHSISILSNWLIYDEQEKQAYLSWSRHWEGSILCKTDIVKDKIKYASLSEGEDTGFVQSLLSGNSIMSLFCPHLYIYTVHSNNTWDRNHFITNFNLSYKLSAETSQIIEYILSMNFCGDDQQYLFSTSGLDKEISSLKTEI